MSESDSRGRNPRVLVLADVASNEQGVIDRSLKPAGIRAWVQGDPQAPTPDVLVVDITQLRGDPLAGLRERRSEGDEAPAIVLAAHFPSNRLRDLFRLGVADILLKPYKPVELCKAIYELAEAQAETVTAQLLARRLQNTREQVRRRSEEIRMLSEIGRTVVRLQSLEDILTRVVEAAAFLTGAEEANIYLAEADSQEVVLRASKSAGESHGALKRLRITDTLAGHVYRTGEPVVRQPEVEGDKVKVQTGFLVQSLIKVPIRIGDTIVGVLGVYNRLAQRRFSDHHVTLLGALADWTGVALEQAGQRARQDAAGLPTSATPQPAEDENSATRVHPDVVSGLDTLKQKIGALINGSTAELPAEQRERLRELHSQVDEIAALPMAVVDRRTIADLIDLDDLVEQVAEELTMAARQRGLELIAETGDGSLMIPGDRQQVHRVIEGLTAAALRRTKRGRIWLELRRFPVHEGTSGSYPLPEDHDLKDGLWVAVRISDSSGGLSPDTLRALSAPTPDPSEGELGSGLSMGELRLIAESLGGRLWHDHTPATTTITFALPAE